ncbi:hypothetical protein AB0H77_22750 [Streptomyces sp. NPDC050844]|uniref:hypothetical protein n=1 Tax=Streptomyces sp. NPDC050844 TaxID=3155790 RepID=UPI0033EE5B53
MQYLHAEQRAADPVPDRPGGAEQPGGALAAPGLGRGPGEQLAAAGVADAADDRATERDRLG